MVGVLRCAMIAFLLFLALGAMAFLGRPFFLGVETSSFFLPFFFFCCYSRSRGVMGVADVIDAGDVMNVGRTIAVAV